MIQHSRLSKEFLAPGCNGTVPSGYSPDGLMTSDDGSSLGMERDSQLSRSPFYWHKVGPLLFFIG